MTTSKYSILYYRYCSIGFLILVFTSTGHGALDLPVATPGPEPWRGDWDFGGVVRVFELVSLVLIALHLTILSTETDFPLNSLPLPRRRPDDPWCHFYAVVRSLVVTLGCKKGMSENENRISMSIQCQLREHGVTPGPPHQARHNGHVQGSATDGRHHRRT